MGGIIISEFAKLKRYSILWIGIVAVFFSAMLAVFQSSSGGGSILYESFYNNIIWNNFSLAFPFMIVLIGGYIINREYTDRTLKNVLTVPISFRKMLTGKLIVLGMITALFAVFSFLCTLLLAFVLQTKGMSIPIVAKSLYQIVGIGLCNYIAILPITTFFCRKQNGFFAGVGFAFVYGFCGIFVAGRGITDFYPITAGLGIFGYTGQGTVAYNAAIGCLALLTMLVISAIFVRRTPNYDEITAAPKKKKKNGKSGNSKRK
jgi:ABC-type transport system involved in multi-copper enzyme maturation permease subunit